MLHEADVSIVYKVLATWNEVGQWSHETNVIALIYVARLVGEGRVVFSTQNWPLVMLLAAMLAQKFQDDLFLTNASFPLLLKMVTNAEVSLKQINEHELHFLDAVRFDLFVTESSYNAVCKELDDLLFTEQ